MTALGFDCSALVQSLDSDYLSWPFARHIPRGPAVSSLEATFRATFFALDFKRAQPGIRGGSRVAPRSKLPCRYGGNSYFRTINNPFFHVGTSFSAAMKL